MNQIFGTFFFFSLTCMYVRAYFLQNLMWNFLFLQIWSFIRTLCVWAGHYENQIYNFFYTCRENPLDNPLERFLYIKKKNPEKKSLKIWILKNPDRFSKKSLRVVFIPYLEYLHANFGNNRTICLGNSLYTDRQIHTQINCLFYYYRR